MAWFNNSLYAQLVFQQKLRESEFPCFLLYNPNVGYPTSEFLKLTVYLQKKKLCLSSLNVILHPFTHLQCFKNIYFSFAVFLFKILTFCFPSSLSNGKYGRACCLTQSYTVSAKDSVLHQSMVTAWRAVSFQSMAIFVKELILLAETWINNYLQVFISPFLCTE